MIIEPALFLPFVSAVNADVAADYLLDRPAFKATTKSTDTLTLNIFDDQACTRQVFAHSLLAGDASISYEKPATQKVTGGTSNGVVLDAGGWGGRIIVKETY